MTEPIRLHIELNSLICHKRVGSGQPYLWTLFFKADQSCIQIDETFHLQGQPEFRFSENGHNGLGKTDKRRLTIPAELGTWQTELIPLHVPYFEQPTVGVAGVVYIALDHHNLSQEGAIAAHKAVNNLVKKAAQKVIRNFEPTQIDLLNFTATLKKYFADGFKKELTGIEDAVVEAVKNSQSLLQNIWTLVHKDNLIGYDFNIFTHFDFEDDPHRVVEFGQRWKTEHGDWEVQGTAVLKS